VRPHAIASSLATAAFALSPPRSRSRSLAIALARSIAIALSRPLAIAIALSFALALASASASASSEERPVFSSKDLPQALGLDFTVEYPASFTAGEYESPGGSEGFIRQFKGGDPDTGAVVILALAANATAVSPELLDRNPGFWAAMAGGMPGYVRHEELDLPDTPGMDVYTKAADEGSDYLTATRILLKDGRFLTLSCSARLQLGVAGREGLKADSDAAYANACWGFRDSLKFNG
jgi:hypothetical protein